MIDPMAPAGDGHTELSEEDRRGLIPTYIATRGELNEAEQRSIAFALLQRPPTTSSLLDDAYLRGLHQDMFREVWQWAGRYRVRETNIGVAPEYISSEVRALVDDAKTWIACATFAPDELAVRFHHRLVAIHAYPNGNGRHGRIAADYLVSSLKHQAFTWGAQSYSDTVNLRSAYLEALRAADEGKIDELLVFARA